jgi:spore coat polysaccharide biosynthesis predicted glycosyltransferase SpsG
VTDQKVDLVEVHEEATKVVEEVIEEDEVDLVVTDHLEVSAEVHAVDSAEIDQKVVSVVVIDQPEVTDQKVDLVEVHEEATKVVEEVIEEVEEDLVVTDHLEVSAEVHAVDSAEAIDHQLHEEVMHQQLHEALVVETSASLVDSGI